MRVADHTGEMSIEPTLEEQELLEETLRRPGNRMSRRELLAILLSAVVVGASIAGLWLIQDPDSFPIVPAVVCLLVLVLSMRVRFDTPAASASATASATTIGSA